VHAAAAARIGDVSSRMPIFMVLDEFTPPYCMQFQHAICRPIYEERPVDYG
jgi:hypothetical protein